MTDERGDSYVKDWRSVSTQRAAVVGSISAQTDRQTDGDIRAFRDWILHLVVRQLHSAPATNQYSSARPPAFVSHVQAGRPTRPDVPLQKCARVSAPINSLVHGTPRDLIIEHERISIGAPGSRVPEIILKESYIETSSS